MADEVSSVAISIVAARQRDGSDEVRARILVEQEHLASDDVASADGYVAAVPADPERPRHRAAEHVRRHAGSNLAAKQAPTYHRLRVGPAADGDLVDVVARHMRIGGEGDLEVGARLELKRHVGYLRRQPHLRVEAVAGCVQDVHVHRPRCTIVHDTIESELQ